MRKPDGKAARTDQAVTACRIVNSRDANRINHRDSETSDGGEAVACRAANHAGRHVRYTTVRDLLHAPVGRQGIRATAQHLRVPVGAL